MRGGNFVVIATSTLLQSIFIVFTDFCCWFPVGVMGLLAAQGMPISGEVNVWTAIFVLPLNSALNPFLYTLNTELERRRRERERRRIEAMMNSLQSDVNTWSDDRVDHMVQHMLKTRRLKIDTWPAEQAVELFRALDFETWSNDQAMELFLAFSPSRWSAKQVMELFRTFNFETWSADQRVELLRTFNPGTWSAEQMIELFRTVNPGMWSDEQVMEILRAWPADQVNALVREMKSQGEL